MDITKKTKEVGNKIKDIMRGSPFFSFFTVFLIFCCVCQFYLYASWEECPMPTKCDTTTSSYEKVALIPESQKEIEDVYEKVKRILAESPDNIVPEDITYNEVVNSNSEDFDNEYYGKIISWDACISHYYSQITGIKFCVVDDDHKNVIYDEPCDWFWAMSDDDQVMSADDIKFNPNWDGHWVPYILNHFNVSFDRKDIYYDDLYTVTGAIASFNRCPEGKSCDFIGTILDVEIISIDKISEKKDACRMVW